MRGVSTWGQVLRCNSFFPYLLILRRAVVNTEEEVLAGLPLVM